VKARELAIAGLALLAAVMSVRTALVQGRLRQNPQAAVAAWPNHPNAVLAAGLVEIGDAAGRGRPVDPQLVERLVSAFARAPLEPEPFLVRGVDARVRGNEALAGQAFLAARARDPRSVAARYFLADHFLRVGDTRRGLAEIATLTRFVPESRRGVAPYLAAFARDPRAAPEIRAMVRNDPTLEAVLLGELASNPNDIGLVLGYWSGRRGRQTREWQAKLLGTLVRAGRFSEAHDAWRRFEPGAQRGSTVGPGFADEALAPFGWTLASGSEGLAEAEANDRLHVIYYGRNDLRIASRVMALPPGQYRLSMRASGTPLAADALSWKIACLPRGPAIGMLGIGRGGAIAQSFAVPASGCGAQQIDLHAKAPEFPEQVDVSLTDFRIAQEGGR
jgi:hypothetical protein